MHTEERGTCLLASELSLVRDFNAVHLYDLRGMYITQRQNCS